MHLVKELSTNIRIGAHKDGLLPMIYGSETHTKVFKEALL